MTHFIRYYQVWEEKNVPLRWIRNHDEQYKTGPGSGLPDESMASLNNSESEIESETKSSLNTIPSGLAMGAKECPNWIDDKELHWDGDSNESWGDSGRD